MSRDSGGNYSLPAGNPVVTGTTISSTTQNSTMSDVGTEITDSLSRSGKGGMLSALKSTDGTVSAPGLTFTNETAVGIYRSGSGEGSLAAGSAQAAKWTAAGFFASLIQSVTAVTMRLLGRQATSGSAVGIITDTDTTYVAGDKLVSIRNNTTEKAYFRYDGQLWGGANLQQLRAVASDQTNSNTVTWQSCTDMDLPVNANETWDVEWKLLSSDGSCKSLEFQIDTPGLARSSGWLEAMGLEGIATSTLITGNTPVTLNAGGGASNFNSYVNIRMNLRTNASGTVAFKFRSWSGSTVTVSTDSYALARKVR